MGKSNPRTSGGLSLYDLRADEHLLVHMLAIEYGDQVPHGCKACVIDHYVKACQRWYADLGIPGVVDTYYRYRARNLHAHVMQGLQAAQGQKIL